MAQISKLIPFIHHLADISAEAIMPSFRKGIVVIHKAGVHDFDPVTEADRAGEAVIRKAINAQYPDHGIVGEEFGSENEDAEYVWVIDPIDGTRSFISGVPVWGTLIGLYKDGKPFIGMMNQPFTQERYWSDGTTSYSAYLKKEQEIKVRSVTDIEQATLLSTGLDFFPEEYERVLFEKVQQRAKLTRFSYDCYGYCMLASGQVDLVVEAGLNIYDIAALIPIVENAGGIVTNWTGGDPSQGGQILASGCEALHEKALKVLAR